MALSDWCMLDGQKKRKQKKKKQNKKTKNKTKIVE
jgi:hypothetical protein